MYSDSFPYGNLDEVTVLVIYVLVFPFVLCNRELFTLMRKVNSNALIQ